MKYGDYFAYSQSVIISEVYLQLSKLYVFNKDSHSLRRLIEATNKFFTNEYYQSVEYSFYRSYTELKKILKI